MPGRSDDGASFPLTYGQQAMWLFERLHPGSTAHHLAYALRILEPLDVPALAAATQLVVDRHPMLRATFDEIDGIPVQTVHPRQVVQCSVGSAAGWDDDHISARLSSEAARSFDLRTGPLVRFTILTRSPAEHVLLVCMHHLVGDMWSMALIADDLTKLYEEVRKGCSVRLPAPRDRFENFVRAEQKLVRAEAGAGHAAFWRDQLRDAPPELGLRRDQTTRTPTDRVASHTITFDGELTSALRRLASDTRASLHDVVLAAFVTLLHRHAAQDDVVVGVLKANRSVRSGRVVGCFVNPVPVRSRLDDDPSFLALVSRLHRTMSEAVPHGAYPFQKLAQELQLGSGMAGRPYLQALFSWDRTTRAIDADLTVAAAHGTAGTATSVNGLRCAPVPMPWRAGPNEITLRAGEIGNQLVATLEYQVDVYEAATIARLMNHLEQILVGAVVDGGCGVGVLPLLSGGELVELEGWAGSVDVGVGGGRLGVGGLFEDRVGRGPDGVAVWFEGEGLTFGELNVRANRLARHLVASGVGAGDVVGVWLERSLEMVVAVLAVLKSGGAFVPLDPAFPPDRLAFMVSDSGARLVVTDSVLLAGGGLPAGLDCVCVDGDAAVIGGYSGENLGVGGSGADLAYVIYTSGSTGRPKGVQVEQGSLVNLLGAMAKRPGLGAGDVVLSVTTLSFDPAFLELLLPLVVGAQVVVVRRQVAADGAALVAELGRRGRR